MKPLCLMVVAGEDSGDLLGADLIAALRVRLGERVRFVGIGGPRMAALGVQSPVDIRGLSVLGVFNALAVYPRVRRAVRAAAALARRERPEAAILIDSWGFTLRVARALRRGQPDMVLIKYVAPQVWATRPGRARVLAGAVDHLLTVHAFDAPLFEAHGLPTTFVGHPVMARDFSHANAARLRDKIGVGAGDQTLLVLPGSRRGEVSRLMPAFGAACSRLIKGRPGLKVVVAAAASVAADVRSRVAAWPFAAIVIEGDADRGDAMQAATAAMACSGTVTTELALAGCPMVVAYRLDPLTALVARRLIRTRYITLFNVAADAFAAPELVQEACSGASLATEIGRLLDEPNTRARRIADQTAAVNLMRGGVADPTAAAVEAIVGLLGGRT